MARGRGRMAAAEPAAGDAGRDSGGGGATTGYHAWRQGPASDEEAGGGYADVPGFCRSAPLDEVRRHSHVLTPGRYVGAPPQPDDGEPFEAKMTRLVADLRAQQAEGARLDAPIAENLKRLGFGD